MKSISNIASVGGSGGGTSSAVLFFEGSSSLEDYTITATSEIGQQSYTTTLDSSGKGYLEVPGLDSYTVVLLHEESGEPVIDYTEVVDVDAGEFCRVYVGYTTSTWAGVKRIINDGKTSQYIQTGDKFNVTVAGEAMVYEACVNTYGLGEVDFIPTYTMSTARYMNSGATNTGGWNASNLRSYLNTTIYESLPDDLKAVISIKDVQVTQGGQVNALITSSDKLWLLAEWEVFGARSQSGSTEDSVHIKYPIFVDNNSRIRTLGPNGAAISYWEASPLYSNSNYFGAVYSGGTATSYNAPTGLGVLPCFRIAPD